MLCWRVQVQHDDAFPLVNAAFQLRRWTTRDTSFLRNVRNTWLCFKFSLLFLFQYFVSQLNCLRLTKLLSAPVWYPPPYNSSSCAELHLQQSTMSDVSTADNVYLRTATDQISQHRHLVSAPDRSLWDMWWTNWHGVPVSVLFQQCSFWLHLVSECRVGPLLSYSVTLAEDIT